MAAESASNGRVCVRHWVACPRGTFSESGQLPSEDHSIGDVVEAQRGLNPTLFEIELMFSQMRIGCPDAL